MARAVNRLEEDRRTCSRGAQPVDAVLRFEIGWGYGHSSLAGERISLLVHDHPASLFGDLPYGDFWLFDDTVVLQMDYDCEGHFLNADHVPRDKVPSYLTCRDRAKNSAIPLDNYLALKRRA